MNCRRCGGSGVEPDNAAIGREMRKLRMGKAITAYAVSVVMGFDKSYISDLELGKRAWSPELQKQYGDAVKKLS